jgi:DNA-binding response OmpR family regulator
MPPTTDANHAAGAILIVDPDESDRGRTRAALETDDRQFVEAATVARANRLLQRNRPNLVITEVILPDGNGFDFVSEGQLHAEAPVIFLTHHGDEDARVRGLDLGAADYVVKPFLPKEFAARVRAALRRADGAAHQPLVHGELTVDVAKRAVRCAECEIHLTRREFDLLAYLAASPGRVISRDELLEQVWATSDRRQDPATVTEHVRRLRLKIEDDPTHPRWLCTVRGIGYRFGS